jgi:hypothetical protein
MIRMSNRSPDRNRIANLVRTLKASAAYFALVFATGFVLGAIRVPLVVPRLGVRTAELLEMPVMLAAIVLAARFVVQRFALPSSVAARLPVGLTALAMLVACELILVVVQGQSAAGYVASRDPVSGPVYLAMLVLYAFMPLAVARRTAGAQL